MACPSWRWLPFLSVYHICQSLLQALVLVAAGTRHLPRTFVILVCGHPPTWWPCDRRHALRHPGFREMEGSNDIRRGRCGMYHYLQERCGDERRTPERGAVLAPETSIASYQLTFRVTVFAQVTSEILLQSTPPLIL